MRKFGYFYGAQADQFTFIRIPRALITNEIFAALSAPAKLLYAILLDRMSLSMRNGWFDEEKRAYIIYQIADIQKDLGFSKRKAIDYLAELEVFGLVEKKKRGFGMPSILYVKSFQTVTDESAKADSGETSDPDPEIEANTEQINYEITMVDADEAASPSFDNDVDNGTEADDAKAMTAPTLVAGEDTVQKMSAGTALNVDNSPRGAKIDTSRGYQSDTSRSAEIDTSEVRKTAPLEVLKSTPLNNKTKENQTNQVSLIESHRIYEHPAEAMGCDEEMFAYGELIKENIAYDSLIQDNPFDRDLIDGIYELILETVLSKRETILIASERYPTALVKSKFLKLDVMHIRYVINCMDKNTTQVKNFKKYMLAVLFNAPSTIDGYYKAAVNHDMPLYAGLSRVARQA